MFVIYLFGHWYLLSGELGWARNLKNKVQKKGKRAAGTLHNAANCLLKFRAASKNNLEIK